MAIFPSPKRHLIEITRRYPGAARMADGIRERAGGQLPGFPQWCFLPLGGAREIVSPSPKGLPTVGDLADAAALAALLSWRPTQGIYRFDPDLFEELYHTPVSGGIPASLLERLPEWCVYVEAPGREVLGRPVEGFFAHLEYDIGTGGRELRFLFDAGEGSGVEWELWPFALDLPEGATLEQSVEATLEASRAQRDLVGQRLQELEGEGQAQSGPVTWRELASLGLDYGEGELSAIASHLSGPISVVLYLASASAELADEAGVSSRPHKPSARKTKKGWRLFPPDSETYWGAGHRMGAALRAARGQAQASPSSTPAGVEGRRRPVAHVRRAHWHSYWRGPRSRPEERELTVKWMAPLLVGAAEPEELLPTIYEVGSNREGEGR